MHILLIGGCGFIGSHVADALLAAGMRLRIYDRRPEAFRPPLPGVEYILGDLADRDLLSAALEGIDAVVHLASATLPASSNLDPSADIAGNLLTTVQLLALMRLRGVQRLIYLSSGGTVYGIPQYVPIPEQHPLQPISSYGIVKVAIENYLYMEHYLHGLRYVVLRPSNPYGPRQGHTGVQGIIGTHLWRQAKGEAGEIWGDGEILRDFIHVRDLARLCLAALRQDSGSGCYNAGSGQGVAIKDIVAQIGQTVAASGLPALAPLYRAGRGFDVPKVVLDIAAARRDFNWQPEISLAEGLAESWAWVQSQNAATQSDPQSDPQSGPQKPKATARLS